MIQADAIELGIDGERQTNALIFAAHREWIKEHQGFTWLTEAGYIVGTM